MLTPSSATWFTSCAAKAAGAAKRGRRRRRRRRARGSLGDDLGAGGARGEHDSSRVCEGGGGRGAGVAAAAASSSGASRGRARGLASSSRDVIARSGGRSGEDSRGAAKSRVRRSAGSLRAPRDRRQATSHPRAVARADSSARAPRLRSRHRLVRPVENLPKVRCGNPIRGRAPRGERDGIVRAARDASFNSSPAVRGVLSRRETTDVEAPRRTWMTRSARLSSSLSR